MLLMQTFIDYLAGNIPFIIIILVAAAISIVLKIYIQQQERKAEQQVDPNGRLRLRKFMHAIIYVLLQQRLPLSSTEHFLNWKSKYRQAIIDKIDNQGVKEVLTKLYSVRRMLLRRTLNRPRIGCSFLFTLTCDGSWE